MTTDRAAQAARPQPSVGESGMKNILEWLAALTGLLVFGSLMSIIIILGMAV